MRVPRVLVPIVLLLAAGEEVEASIAPRTGDVLVSTYTSGFRANPSIAATGDGHFVVVWQESLAPETDPTTHIRGRKLDENGALLGTEFQIDNGAATARGPAIAPSGDGQFTVVWYSQAGPSNSQPPRLLAQRIGEDGAAIGTEFQVNTARTLEGDYYLSEPAIARAGTNVGEGFVVVWSSGIVGTTYNQSFGPNSEVYERRFFSNGDALGIEDIVSEPGGEASVRAEIAPDIDALPDGDFVVTWAKGYFSGFSSSFQTVARRLYPSGQPTGSEIFVGENGAAGPRVAARAPAGFSVMWSTYGFVDYVPQFGGDLVARTFDSSAQPIAERSLVSTPVSGLDPRGDPLRPYAGVNGIAGSSSSAGEFVVAWTSGPSHFESAYYGGSSDGSDSGIFARPFGRDDVPSGREVQVNARAEGDQKRPDLAFGDGDTLAIAWDSDDDSAIGPDRIYARVFDVITPACGDADEDGTSDATDALFVLQAAVGIRPCAACLCDVNSSTAVTAADALIVLRAAVGTISPFTCPPCAPSTVKFAVQSDATCWGAHVEVPAEAVPSGALDQGCAADPSLALLGCSASFTSEGGALTFDARGCFLDPADLFSCTVSQSEAAAMAEASSTACGCGCADTCPTAPVLCAATDAGPACAISAALVSSADQSKRNANTSISVAAPAQETVTSSTTCGTCCDYYDDDNIAVQSDTVVTELLVRYPTGADPSCFGDASCEFDPAIDGPTYSSFEGDGTTVDVCFSDPEGIDGPTTVATCSILTGSASHVAAEVVRALGPDLKPIVPAPVVAVE